MALVSRWVLNGSPADQNNANNGTESGTVVYDLQSVIGGRSMLCDGGADFIDLGSFRFSGNTNYSIAIWFRLTGAGVSCFFSDSHSSASSTVRVASSGGRLYYQIFNSGTSLFNIGTTLDTYNDNKWHLFIVSDANGTVTSYIDNAASGSSGSYTRASITLDHSSIGADRRSSPAYYTGNINDVRYYDHILSEEERTQIWLSRVPRWQTPISRWSLEGNGNDYYGRNNGTIGGTPMYSGTNTKEKGLSFVLTATSPSFLKVDSLNPHSYTNFTVSFWMLANHNVNSYGPCYYSVGVGTGTSPNTSVILETVTGKMFFGVSTTYTKLSDYNYSDNSWHLLTFVDSNGSVVIYDNGVYLNTVNYTRWGAATKFTFAARRIGTLDPQTGYECNGSLDDVRFYDIALTADEVMSLYRSYETPKWNQPLYQWKLDGNANDSAGNLNGTHIGTVRYTSSDKVSGSFSLNCDGSASYIDCGSNKFSNFTNYTLSSWFKAPSGASGTLFEEGNTASGYKRVALLLSSDHKLYYAVATDSSFPYLLSSTLAIYDDNKWHNFLITDSNGTVSGYIDGIKDNAFNSSYTRSTINSDRLWIASHAGSSPNYWTGKLDDIRVYDYALSAAEVRALYNSYFSEKAANFIGMMG
jgi:hypothetical protein